MALLGRGPIRPLMAGLAGLAVVASACSGGASPKASTTTTPNAPGDTSIAVPLVGGVPGPNDQRLQAIVLSAADLPTGWTPKVAAATASSQAATALSLAHCLGIRNIDVNLVAGVMSEDFTKGSITISSTAHSYLSDDDVTTAKATFTNPKVTACYQQLFTTPGTGGAAPVQNVSVKVTPGSAGGPSNVVAVITLSPATKTAALAPPTTVKKPTTRTSPPSSKETTTVKPVNGFNGTIVFITGPKLTAEIAFLGVGDAAPASLQTALIAKLAARAAQG